MPSVSKAQHGAMQAACYGKSTLGIPKKVGCEYVEKDRGRKFTSAATQGTRRKRP